MGEALAIAQEFTNIDAQADQLSGFDQHYEQIDGGKYKGSFFAATASEASVFIETTNRTLWQCGAGPTGRLSAVLLLQEGDDVSTCNGVEFTRDSILVVGAGGSYDAAVSQGAVPVVIDVPVEKNPLLARQAARLDGAVRKVEDAALAAKFRSLGLRALRSYDPHTLNANIPEAEAAMLMMSLVTSQAASGGSAHRSVRLVRDAHALMLGAIAHPEPITELAARLNVSRRALESAFRSCTGTSPARFRRSLQLNNMRRLLEAGQHSVTDAAFASGLRHLGRASADYRSQFDELPSATLARCFVV